MTAKKKIVLALSLLAIVALAIVIGQWRANTGLHDYQTKAVKDSFYVADYAEVLQEETIKKITNENKSLFKHNGSQIVVVVEPNLAGQDIAQYAAAYYAEQKIGAAAYNNGFLLVLAVEEDTYYALPGSGLGGAFSTEVLGELLSTKLEPDFAKKNYDSGVSKFFTAVYDTLKALDYSSIVVPEVATSKPPFPTSRVVIVVLVYLVSLALSGKIARLVGKSQRPASAHNHNRNRSYTQKRRSRK